MTEINKKRWQQLAGILTERTSPEAAQDLNAYFGSNESLDGPYKELADEQPFEIEPVNKHLVEGADPSEIEATVVRVRNHPMRYSIINDLKIMADGHDAAGIRREYYPGWSDEDFQKVLDALDGRVDEQKVDDSPASRNPSREDEEEAMAMYMQGDYPATAAEYAKQLNAKRQGSFKLADDQEHWDKAGVRTGEELAKYLAIEAHRDAFKELYGVRPRHMNYDEMSIEQLEARVEQMYQEMEDLDDDDDIVFPQHDDDEPDAPDEVDVEFGKYEDLEADWDEKLYGKR